jgi:hypothetical protein
MKRTIPVLLFSILMLQLLAQTPKELEITFEHKLTFPHLLKAGDRQRFVQLCAIAIDSVVQGTINFKTAAVGKIEECKLSMRIIADTVRNYKVETADLKNTKQLTEEAISRYGKFYETKKENGKNLVYTWKEPFSNGRNVITSLTVTGKKKNGILLSKME